MQKYFRTWVLKGGKSSADFPGIYFHHSWEEVTASLNCSSVTSWPCVQVCFSSHAMCLKLSSRSFSVQNTSSRSFSLTDDPCLLYSAGAFSVFSGLEQSSTQQIYFKFTSKFALTTPGEKKKYYLIHLKPFCIFLFVHEKHFGYSEIYASLHYNKCPRV